MQKIRRGKQKMRVPLIIMVVILAVGLVGSFAIWSSPNMKNSGQNEVKPEDRIKNFQVSIDSLEKDLKNKPNDFSILKSLADVQNDQASLYAQVGDKEKSKEVFTKGLENYLRSLDYAPEELNAQGKADIMVQAAFCASNADQGNTAGALYQQAIELVPEDFTTRYNYVLFLAFYRQDLTSAKEEITKYKAVLKDGDERIAQADQLMKTIEELEKAASETKGDANQTPPAENSDQAKDKQE